MNPEVNTDAVFDAKSLGTSKTLILGLQHMFAMFGATVLVPAITGLNVSTTLFFAGLGTLLFHPKASDINLGLRYSPTNRNYPDRR